MNPLGGNPTGKSVMRASLRKKEEKKRFFFKVSFDACFGFVPSSCHWVFVTVPVML